jgi:transposase InsO family protein
MDEETKNNIKQIQRENNYPGFERLVALVRAKYKRAISRQEIREFLDKDIPTQLYATKQKLDAYGHTVAFRENELWQIDIFYIKSGNIPLNDGFKYVFVVIDVFSRKAYVEPMKTKTTEACLDALQTIIDKKVKALPRAIIADQDSAFKDSEWQSTMTESSIAFSMNALKDHHALGIIDNFAKRFKTAINRNMEDDKTHRWIDFVPNIINNYNKTPNSSLDDEAPNNIKKNIEVKPDMTEAQVKATQKNRDIVGKIVGANVDKSQDNKTKTDLEIGDKVRKDVRVSESNTKGTDPRWSDKVFTVKAIKGQTITLNDDSKYKRQNLLKVPADTESTATDVVQSIKNKQRKED